MYLPDGDTLSIQSGYTNIHIIYYVYWMYIWWADKCTLFIENYITQYVVGSWVCTFLAHTPPPLPINCLYVCLVPILASGICFIYSSRHLVCITARHTAFGDICQQHQESSFLQIFYDIIFYGYRIYLAIIYFIHYILLISVNNIGNRAFSWFPADFYAVSCHARCRFGCVHGEWDVDNCIR